MSSTIKVKNSDPGLVLCRYFKPCEMNHVRFCLDIFIKFFFLSSNFGKIVNNTFGICYLSEGSVKVW